ncbi:hypothetical protein Bbelb_403920 [Branchiostoma belcheri]|nr:hypothetical protein Bbelb_403920 [Branchiostoma belcheri]
MEARGCDCGRTPALCSDLSGLKTVSLSAAALSRLPGTVTFDRAAEAWNSRHAVKVHPCAHSLSIIPHGKARHWWNGTRWRTRENEGATPYPPSVIRARGSRLLVGIGPEATLRCYHGYRSRLLHLSASHRIHLAGRQVIGSGGCSRHKWAPNVGDLPAVMSNFRRSFQELDPMAKARFTPEMSNIRANEIESGDPMTFLLHHAQRPGPLKEGGGPHAEVACTERDDLAHIAACRKIPRGDREFKTPGEDNRRYRLFCSQAVSVSMSYPCCVFSLIAPRIHRNGGKMCRLDLNFASGSAVKSSNNHVSVCSYLAYVCGSLVVRRLDGHALAIGTTFESIPQAIEL